MLATDETPEALAIIDDEARISVIPRSGELSGAGVGRVHFVGGEALQPHRGVAVVRVQLEAPGGTGRVSGLLPGRLAFRLVGERDRPAEMRHRLLEGRTPQRLLARIAPPVDRQIPGAGRGEVAGDRLRLQLRGDERQGRAPVQRLTPASEQAVVGGVLNQRMLEAIGRLRRNAVDKENVGVDESP